jgi:hypothetical protein
MHQNLPLAGTGQACQDADQGGLASAIGAQQTKELALFNFKADLIERTECGSARLFGRVGFRDGLK